MNTGIDVRYFANRHKAYDEPLPWDHIDCGVTKGYLRAEDVRARKVQKTHDCHTEPCTFCLSCDRAYWEGAKGKKQAAEFADKGLTLLPLTTDDRERLGLQV